jgi:acetyltransferase-like isoleucine patch superfamily enzyme
VIHPDAKIECDELIVGEGTIIRAHAEIYGGRVVLGRESFIDEYAVIGGGQAGDLTTGDWFHLGMFAQVNTARPVKIGDEVGIGIGSRIFTHGAYLSEYDGFPVKFAPVTIGSRVWIPNAIVMPGVTIGDDVVVGAGSVVTHSIGGNQFVVGSPATEKGPAWRPLSIDDRIAILRDICTEADAGIVISATQILCKEPEYNIAEFNVAHRTIDGIVTAASERLREQLRRHGIRFRYSPVDGKYEAWT